MKVSVSIELVWQLAGHEAIAGAFKEIEPEHFLMALLKFADLPVAEIEKLGAGAEAVQALTSDVQAIREVLDGRGIDATAVRRAIRTALGKGDHKYDGGRMHRAQASRVYFDKAALLAAEAGNDVLTGRHVLDALLAEPTSAVAKALAGCSSHGRKALATPKTPVLDEFGKKIQARKQPEDDRNPHARLTEAKAVIHALAQPRRNCVLLETGSDTLLHEILTSVAQLLEAKEVPASLKEKKLLDLSEIEVTGKKAESNMDRLQTMINEAEAAKNVILVFPPLAAQGHSAKPAEWVGRLKAVGSTATAQFVVRLAPGLRGELEKDPVWRKMAQIITLQEKKSGSIPLEL
jgi:ATP-dependent Clp protease ATP-binding subunit ClpA